jgi:alpha-tubulin suppressor-like RCC1 family protein
VPSEGDQRFELRVIEVEDPLPGATFGSIGRYVEVVFTGPQEERFVPQRLTLRFDESAAQHVDVWTLMLFRVDRETREFTPVESSRVDVDRREVTAWVDEPGIYGLIGLPTHSGVLETLRLLDRYAPQLQEESSSGDHGLQDRICGLILCADPTLWDDPPKHPGDLCEMCLGLDVSWGRLPERYLFERLPERPRFREVLDADEPVGGPSLLGWGTNGYGQVGDGSTTTRTTPVWVVPRLTVKKVVGAVAGDWTLALGTDGTVWAWGFNASGQLGDGTLVAHRSTPVRVGLLDNVVDIAAGPIHGVAVRADGSVWRWGYDSPFASQPDRLPVRVAGLSGIVAVAAGIDFTLALRNDGRVFAWGMNGSGQLGDGTQQSRPSSAPLQVPGLTAVRAIAAGLSVSFAIKSNGAVVGWGAAGSVGDGTMINRFSPVPLPGLTSVEQISYGGHALARTTAGEVWFWGSNPYGQRGDGTSSGVYLSPVRVPGLPQITSIAAGQAHSLAMQSNGTVWAWGWGQSGQLGIGPAYTQETPIAVPLPGARRAVSVGAGERSSFAVLG